MAPAAAKMQLRSGALPGTHSDGGDSGKSISISTPSSFLHQIKRISVSMPPFLAADGMQEDTCSHRDVEGVDAGVQRPARGDGQHLLALQLSLQGKALPFTACRTKTLLLQ